MSRIDWKERVVFDPEIHHGDPCIKGTRVPVSRIVGSIADGMSFMEGKTVSHQTGCTDCSSYNG